MRFLKNKIALAKAARSKPAELRQNNADQNKNRTQTRSIGNAEPKRRNRIAGCCQTPEKSRSTKNIVKNYGRAICSFATSPIATPYLNTLIKDQDNLKNFLTYVKNMKKKITGLSNFRRVLVPQKTDTQETVNYKSLFKFISEIFIKFFSVNWIFHSKVCHKDAHLKFRFRMLRRIQQPELFTYLKSFKQNIKN